MRRHSQSILQDLVNKRLHSEARPRVKKAKGTHTPTLLCPLAMGSLITRRGSLVLTDRPNAVEVYRPSGVSQQVSGARLSDIYLPMITGKMSNLQSARLNLSHSCPYLYTSRRRGSTSSGISQRASDVGAKQVSSLADSSSVSVASLVQYTVSDDMGKSYLKEQKDSRKSNVLVTMTYLGQGKPGPTQDEMRVLQQICGGENVCVFKGSVQPGDQFQFTSQRHLGYPFSATFYVNGIMAGRISSCCEYRYMPGFQQGRKGYFQLCRLSGGKPCYKCVNSRHGIGREAKKLKDDNSQPVQSNEGVLESRSSSPLFIPLGMERPVQRTRTLHKDTSVVSTDSEDINGTVNEKKRHKHCKGRRNHRGHCQGSEESQVKRDSRDDDAKPPDSNHQSPLLEKLGTVKKQGKEKPGTDNHVRAPEYERNKIKEQITLDPHLNGSASEVELSEESDNSLHQSKRGKSQMNTNRVDTLGQDIPENNASEKEQELQKKLDAMTEVLSISDEVEQLVLRNTGITDELLKGLAAALKNSLSEVTMINLNLNHIGPPGVHVLLDLLEAKLGIKGLLLFGNQLGDAGVQILLNGVADLQDKTASPGVPEQFYLPAPNFTLVELDLGGNRIGSEGLRVLGTYMKFHSHLQYLGLAQTSCSNMEVWTILFESLKMNTNVAHIILDENNLGDQGIKLFAEALRVNESLRKVDLDSNGFGEAGGNAILEALLSRRFFLKHLSLEDNYISTTLMSKIQQAIKSNSDAP
ncbi:hypothetical protein P4O66_012262 [Electrophorus voltai]|uniref:DUF4590 domain-containing protein n=1 Tax=Electrophorus voltai TaxID=2609070 RepID=A0AAD8Z4F5_9TELE|nr:hypothetical protein P4O66_012262 [Electrophorus voltai]